MNNRTKIAPVVTIIFYFLHTLSFAQITTSQLQQYVQNAREPNKETLRDFYNYLGYQPAWVQPKSIANLTVIYNDMQQSPAFGLNPQTYNLSLVQLLLEGKLNLKTSVDSLEAEVNITQNVIHFYTDYAFGDRVPSFGYQGLTYTISGQHISILLAEHIVNGKIASFISLLSAGVPEIKAIEYKLKWITNIVADSLFKEVTNIPLKPKATNTSLLLKLYQLGIIDSITTTLPDSAFNKKIKAAQQQFGLLSDGVIRSTLIKELNIPLTLRLQQLNTSINYYKWLNRLTQYPTLILVNIPSAYMKVYQNGTTMLEMKLVVGKPSTPTPTLTSVITDIIIYPYWHVPYSIATKEILPIVKNSPDYINKAGYQILDNKGNIIDPSTINWRLLSAKYFPYTIRQSTGCDNALGLLKLNFYNPYDVYLHDTPMKNAFSLSKRYFSHGCMRMEKPMELGHLILKNNSIAIDTLEQKGCLRNQSPVTIHATQQIPVIVWYNPVGVDAKGRLVFYEDIYRKLL